MHKKHHKKHYSHKYNRKNKNIINKSINIINNNTSKIMPNIKKGLENIGSKVISKSKKNFLFNKITNKIFGMFKKSKTKKRH